MEEEEEVVEEEEEEDLIPNREGSGRERRRRRRNEDQTSFSGVSLLFLSWNLCRSPHPPPQRCLHIDSPFCFSLSFCPCEKKIFCLHCCSPLDPHACIVTYFN